MLLKAEKVSFVVDHHDNCASQQGTSESLRESDLTSMVLNFLYNNMRFGLCDFQVFENLWLSSKTLRTTYHASVMFNCNTGCFANVLTLVATL